MKQLIAIPVLGVLLAGCFTMQPVERATPEIGAEVALSLNDAGRAALGPSMGQEIDQIHGHLIQRDSDTYAVAVTSIEFLRGGSQPRRGEIVRVRSDYTDGYYENRLAVGRTVAVSAAIVGGVAILSSQALTTGGTGVPTEGPPPPPGKVRAAPGLHIPIAPGSAARMFHRLMTAITGI